tara:strand:- start:10 stop:618 length:609 start_codon:yes stop_codon:yes gene_type:complete
MEDLESYYQTSFCFVAFLFSSSFSSSFSLPAAVRPRLYPVILPSSSLPVLTELSFSSSTPSSKQMKVSCHFSYQEAFQHPAVRPAAVEVAHLAVDSVVDALETRLAVFCARCLLEEVLGVSADVAKNQSTQMKSIRTSRTGKAVVLCLVVVLEVKARVDLVVSEVALQEAAVARPVVEVVLLAALRHERETCLEDVRDLRCC